MFDPLMSFGQSRPMPLPPPPSTPSAPHAPQPPGHVAPPAPCPVAPPRAPAPAGPGLPWAPKPMVPMLSRAASVLTPEAQEQMMGALQQEGANLEEKIREIMAARSHGGHTDVGDRLRDEQLQAKGAMINKLQEELGEEINRMEQGSNLKEEIHQYEAQRAALNREIQNAKDAIDHSDVGKLRDEVHRADERCRQLTTQLQRLEVRLDGIAMDCLSSQTWEHDSDAGCRIHPKDLVKNQDSRLDIL